MAPHRKTSSVATVRTKIKKISKKIASEKNHLNHIENLISNKTWRKWEIPNLCDVAFATNEEQEIFVETEPKNSTKCVYLCETQVIDLSHRRSYLNCVKFQTESMRQPTSSALENPNNPRFSWVEFERIKSWNVVLWNVQIDS